VIIIGCEVGLTPMRASDPEERRAFYVALTRAEQAIHLTWARRRSMGGRVVDRSRSPFLDDIETAEAPEATDVDPREELGAARLGLRDRRADGDTAGRLQLMARLQRWRTDRARVGRVEPGALLSDLDLDKIATSRPATLEELAEVTDLGPARLRRFGPAVLSLLADDDDAIHRGSGQS
jgi:DNA helicase-2/ATP-dependent DNA helicase PcrA